jgi:thiol-disulfide isomerase/thioredoxin
MENTILKTAIRKTIPVDQYINEIPQPFKDKFLYKMRVYHIDEQITTKLREHAKDLVVIVFSAEWCKDCAENVPILAKLAEETGIDVFVFGGLKTNPLNQKEKWSIPPSPPEVKQFNVQRIPHIIIFNKKGKELGVIIENPKPGLTLEKEIFNILQLCVN